MSSFKSYGKVDEHEQMMLDARRKTRKRITIISLSSIILAGVVFATVFGIVNNSRGNSQSGNNAQSLTNSFKAVCDVTLYKDSCYRSLGSLYHSGQVQVQPEELFKFSIKVALTEVSKAVIFFSENGVFKGLNDSRTKEALENCRDLLDLAVDHLNSSLTSAENSSLLDVFDDHETWLSAAGTYQQTCIEGFEDAKEALKESVVSYLKNSTHFTSNSLAIITWINKASSTLNLRRLLSLPFQNEAPEWLHSKDRKLLGTKDLKGKVDIVVAKDGSGKYKTISAALKLVPNKSNKRTVIYVKRGVYYENVRVEKTKWNVMIIGDGMNATIVSGSRNFVDGTPTFSTATFAVFGRNFIARDMGFRNTAGPKKQQAVALMTSADRAVYYRCHIDAYQDTLYAHSNRQFYRECNIYGTVDFIFGNSAVILQNCNILPKLPILGQQNTITAQGKFDPNMNTGISIQNCNISPFGNLSSVQTYLGRPWKNYSTTVYMRSRMESFINPKGWLPWVGNSAPDTLFYAEFQNVGEGAITKNRVKWKGLRTITSKKASMFTIKVFLQGDRWIPASGAPFKSDL
ncbi:LOW QUALITY PROTEIN: putative pectinesterase/pectinesterase inhibitor 24 [Gastrolobium bilobum]|uniref:LOW QUALITY PROTEIN: putative pectinesterase/pectinesterase inhibitor 24 n=1 Tax=Gastrolobium bilobum TaxID=150636 RepID=UPI002AB25A6C|nr:LOW QUALITY PROTEIN: putative pectinesterase/pectinesterase inhibitor 24 [Gastrolobium bilobum]